MAIRITSQLDPATTEALHGLYQNESWSRGRSLEETRQVVANSTLCLAALDEDNHLAGFARVLSDKVFKALIFDVIVAPEHRSLGLGECLIQTIQQHPDLAQVRHFELYCLPALEPFYARYGFTTDTDGMRLMRCVRAAASPLATGDPAR